MKYIVLFFIFVTTLFSGVNSLFLYNIDSINNKDIYIPLPDNQIIARDEDVIYLLIKANETLLIKDFLEEDSSINVSLSLDGKLFKKAKNIANKTKELKYRNLFDKAIAYKIFYKKENTLSLFTTNKDIHKSKLNTNDLLLDANEVTVHSLDGNIKKNYYTFNKNDEFIIEIEKEGTLELLVRESITPLHSIGNNRHKILITDENHQSTTWNYVSSLNKNNLQGSSPVSNTASYFLHLHKGKNYFKVQVFNDTLVRVKYYHANLINDMNDNSIWTVPPSYAQINQDSWKNTNLNDGLKRYNSINNIAKQLAHSPQHSAFVNSAKKSIYLGELYPSEIPFKSQLKYKMSASPSLYLEDELELELLSAEQNFYDIVDISAFKNSMFVDIPYQNSLQITGDKHQLTLRKLYFKVREFKLDKALLHQIKLTLPEIEKYNKILISGFTDSIDTNSNNQLLSEKRSSSVKNALVSLGIPKENIFTYSHGEGESEIITDDNMYESSNRMVKITVLHTDYKNKDLVYTFKETLVEDLEIEINLYGENLDEAEKLNLYVDDEIFMRMDYNQDNKYQDFSYNKEMMAYKRVVQETSSKKVLSVLKNVEDLELVNELSTTLITIPKGSKSIRFTRENRGQSKDSKVSISLRIPKNKLFVDSNYALNNIYHGTYKAFASSVKDELFLDFDSWYEHTHGLRLWMKQKVSRVYDTIEIDDIPNKKDLDYADKLLQNNDLVTATHIAKHALILCENPKLQKQAYNILLNATLEPTKKIVWHLIYFLQTKSSGSLKVVSKNLYNEGKLKLSLDSLMLLRRNEIDDAMACNLFIMENNTKMSKEFCHDEEEDVLSVTSFLKKKEDLQEKLRYKNYFIKEKSLVKNFSGLQKLYTKRTKKNTHIYRATWAQPLELNVSGSREIEFKVHVKPSQTDKYRWVRIEDNGVVYHYPITNFKASEFSVMKPSDQEISSENSIKIILDDSTHNLKIHGYTQDLFISFNSRKVLQEEIIPLKQQIFKTTGYKFEKIFKHQSLDTIEYATSLLWNYDKASPTYRYHAIAQALVLSEITTDKAVKRILNIITPYHLFQKYDSLGNVSGLYSMNIPNWNPISQVQKNRTPFLEKINDYDFVLSGNNYKKLHMEGDQKISFLFKQIKPKYLTATPIVFGITLDEKDEMLLSIEDFDIPLTKSFVLGNGEHSVKMRLIDPYSTSYLGVNILDTKSEIVKNKTRIFKISDTKEPIFIQDIGPKLFRVEKQYSNEYNSSFEYIFFKEPKEYIVKIKDTHKGDSTLLNITQMVIDPVVTPLNKYMRENSNVQSFTDNRNKGIDENADMSDMLYSYDNIFENINHTCSLGANILSYDTSGEDVQENDTTSSVTIEGYCRKRINDSLYLKGHYYIRNFENPLYTFEHKAYIKLPIWNMYSTVETNIYFQDNDYLKKNIAIRAKLMKRDRFNNGFRHEYGLGVFKYFLDDGIASLYDYDIDPLVYSKYKQNHQYGINYNYNLSYRIYNDLELRLDNQINTNEAVNIFDNTKIKASIAHLAYPFYFKAFYDNRYYFEDLDRREGYFLNRIGLKLKYDKFFDTNRVSVEAQIVQKLETKEFQFSLGLVWHFSSNKIYYNFDPDEIAFKNLRILNEDY